MSKNNFSLPIFLVVVMGIIALMVSQSVFGSPVSDLKKSMQHITDLQKKISSTTRACIDNITGGSMNIFFECDRFWASYNNHIKNVFTKNYEDIVQLTYPEVVDAHYDTNYTVYDEQPDGPTLGENLKTDMADYRSFALQLLNIATECGDSSYVSVDKAVSCATIIDDFGIQAQQLLDERSADIETINGETS